MGLYKYYVHRNVELYYFVLPAQQTPLRIVPLDDSLPNRGRVEVEIGGKWGTICNFDTSKETVLVLCRGIGYMK